MPMTLKVKDIQEEFGLGRDLSAKIAQRLPHATIGKTLMVRREDVERLLERAIQDGADLWDLVREHDSPSLLAWLRAA